MGLGHGLHRFVALLKMSTRLMELHRGWGRVKETSDAAFRLPSSAANENVAGRTRLPSAGS